MPLFQKKGHMAWNCRFRANDVLKGKLKGKPHGVNVTKLLKIHQLLTMVMTILNK
jgi:hypothetical protein